MYNVVNMPDLVQLYFSSSLWLGAFIVSVIYLFFRANSAKKRAIIAASCGFFLIINAFVIRIFSSLGENATFYRHLWAIPTAAIIGIAIVDLIRIIPKWFLKIPAIAAFAVFLWFANQEYIRCRDQFFSRNAKMVHEDVIPLAEKLEQIRIDTGKNVLYVVCPMGYSRPYGDMPTELNLYSGFLIISNSSILNDSEHNGEAQLMLENPDVPYIMSICCSKGIDYVIVSNNESAKNAFEQVGYDAVTSTDVFLVYPCFGYKGYKQDLNIWGQVSWKAYYNETGDPDIGTDGWSTVQYSYDGKGNKTKEQYYGVDGNPFIISAGYAAVEYEYNHLRKCTKEIYLDQDEIPVNQEKGYAFALRTYTAIGLVESEKFFDQENRPVLISGRYETRNEYDNDLRLVKESYFDVNGNPMNRTDLDYASKEIEYDKTGRVITEHYYDTDGKSKICGLGYASYTKIQGEDGETLCEKYFNSEEKLIGEVSEDRHTIGDNVFRFFHTTDGIEIQDNIIKMSTSVYNNRFNSIRFQLLDSKGNYLLDFARSSALGTFTGRYTHELPDGLYMLRLKGNTNLKDESVYSLVYLTKGDSLVCQYDLLELADNYIAVKDASVAIQ